MRSTKQDVEYRNQLIKSLSNLGFEVEGNVVNLDGDKMEIIQKIDKKKDEV